MNKATHFLATGLAAALLSSCTADDSQSGSDVNANGAHDAPSTVLPTYSPPEDPRPFEPLETDSPGGPNHDGALPTRPALVEVAESANASDGRLEAEQFAIYFVNALMNQPADLSKRRTLDDFENFLDPDLPQEARQWMEVNFGYPYAVVSPSGEPCWIRSRLDETPDGTVATVQLVELVEVADPFDSSIPFRFWGMWRIDLSHASGSWRIVDFRPRVASETEEFNPYTFEDVMDSGEGWRRFTVS